MMLSQHDQQGQQGEREIRYFAQDESRFGLKTLIGRLITACGVKPVGAWQCVERQLNRPSNDN